MTMTSPAASSIRLEARPLADNQWRIIDPSRTERDGIDLVAFVECADGVYEVIRIGYPLEREHFLDLETALDYLEGVSHDRP